MTDGATSSDSDPEKWIRRMFRLSSMGKWIRRMFRLSSMSWMVIQKVLSWMAFTTLKDAKDTGRTPKERLCTFTFQISTCLSYLRQTDSKAEEAIHISVGLRLFLRPILEIFASLSLSRLSLASSRSFNFWKRYRSALSVRMLCVQRTRNFCSCVYLFG